jgi:Transposase DDE domain
MVEANLKIITELKLVLEEVSSNKEIKALFINSEGSFSRERKLTLQRLVGILINMPKRSLSIELKEFFDILNDKNPATKGAFSLQRSKLLPVFFQVWNTFLIDSFYKHYGDKIKRWKGFILLAVDGSTANLVNKKDVVDFFGTWDNQHASTPMARIVQAYDVLNDVTVLSGIYPIKKSEKAIINNRVDNLFSDSLTLFDRGYPSYELMYLMIHAERPKHFVIRCKADFNTEVKQLKKSRKNSKIIELKATSHAIAGLRTKGFIVTANTSIRVRIVKVKLSSGENEILLTNLYNEQLYTIDDLNYLYGMRWGIETSYGMQKNQLQLEQFSGHRVICIQQDFHASVFVANLQSLINKQCEGYLKKINTRRKYKYKINRNVSLGALKNNIVKLFFQNEPLDIMLKLQSIFELNTEPIRPGRQYTRTAKVKFRRGKYRTLTNYKRAI